MLHHVHAIPLHVYFVLVFFLSLEVVTIPDYHGCYYCCCHCCFLSQADPKLLSIFSTAQLRSEKPEWQELLMRHAHSLTDDEVIRLKQLRRRSKSCVYAGGNRQKRQRKQKLAYREQTQLADDNVALRAQVATLRTRVLTLEAKLAAVGPLA